MPACRILRTSRSSSAMSLGSQPFRAGPIVWTGSMITIEPVVWATTACRKQGTLTKTAANTNHVPGCRPSHHISTRHMKRVLNRPAMKGLVIGGRLTNVTSPALFHASDPLRFGIRLWSGLGGPIQTTWQGAPDVDPRRSRAMPQLSRFWRPKGANPHKFPTTRLSRYENPRSARTRTGRAYLLPRQPGNGFEWQAKPYRGRSACARRRPEFMQAREVVSVVKRPA